MPLPVFYTTWFHVPCYIAVEFILPYNLPRCCIILCPYEHLFLPFLRCSSRYGFDLDLPRFDLIYVPRLDLVVTGCIGCSRRSILLGRLNFPVYGFVD